MDPNRSEPYLNMAILRFKQGKSAEALPLFMAAKGCHGVQLHRGVEDPGNYTLMVRWATLEDHTVGFRQSAQYQQWRALLHHFYDPFPTVLHYSAAELK